MPCTRKPLSLFPKGTFPARPDPLPRSFKWAVLERALQASRLPGLAARGYTPGQGTDWRLGFSSAPSKDSLEGNPVAGPTGHSRPVPQEDPQPGLKALPAGVRPSRGWDTAASPGPGPV